MTTGASQSTRELGNYEVLSKIAEGGMGAVYKARHRETGLVVAIKVIPPETAKNPILKRRFEQEFRAASLIDHPNVVKAIEFSHTGTVCFLVMEYIDGPCLGDRIVDRQGMSEQEALHIISQICAGLHSAHKQGLIHRDVKPDNILIGSNGVAKITDLGLVKDVEAEMNLTRTGKGLGTPHYMSPEQFRNAKNADVRCDIYSLGATLYMMLTGRVPFEGTSPLDCWLRKTKNDLPSVRTFAPQVSERVSFAINRAMNAEPSERPASCREFMEDLLGTRWRLGQDSAANLIEKVDQPELWYMVYYVDGTPKTVKGTTDIIRRNIIAGTLGEPKSILVSRSKAGPFSQLRLVPAFRDLVISSESSSVNLLGTPLVHNARSTVSSSVDHPTPIHSPDTAKTPKSPASELADRLRELSERADRLQSNSTTKSDIEIPLVAPDNLDKDSSERPKIHSSRSIPVTRASITKSSKTPTKTSKFSWSFYALLILIGVGLGVTAGVLLLK